MGKGRKTSIAEVPKTRAKSHTIIGDMSHLGVIRCITEPSKKRKGKGGEH